MIANCLGDKQFNYPDFSGEGGLPLNLEHLLRMLESRYGQEISPLDLPQALMSIHSFIDRVEDYWERGEGLKASQTGPIHRNLAVWGYELGDCDTLSADQAQKGIPFFSRTFPFLTDNHLIINEIPDAPMYRTAMRTLNPSLSTFHSHLTQIDSAKKIATDNGSIENLIVFLGNNNCLGTVVDLEKRLSEASDVNSIRPHRKKESTLWKVEHFKDVLERIAPKIDEIGAENVFIGTVPPVTIPPITRGVTVNKSANGSDLDEHGHFEYYTYFFIWDDDFKKAPHKYPHLKRHEIKEIEDTIESYNNLWKREAQQRGWHIVDLHSVLKSLAFRRQQGNITYTFPSGLINAMRNNPKTAKRVKDDGTLLLDTRYLCEREESGKNTYVGGLFSLDGVHPTTIGYGLLAHEFIEKMKTVNPDMIKHELDWDEIVKADTLVTQMPENLKNLKHILGSLAKCLGPWIKSLRGN